jgi:hypothetical protein
MYSPSRRRFLKVGVAAATLLALVRVAECSGAAKEQARGSLDLRVLNGKSAELVAALAPVILAGGLPDASEARAIAVTEVVDAMDRAIAGLSPAVQEEVQQLLSLLTFAPTRALIAGVWKPWSEASGAEVAEFLDGWRNSRFALLQSGYQAIKQLMQACWYGNPLSWGKNNYPGPPHATALGL